VRVQLARALALAGGLALGARAAAAAEVSVDNRSSVYQDSDRTTVATSTLAASARVKEVVTVSARGLVDAISSASVDVVTAATGRFHERRYEWAGGLAYDDRTSTASLTYIRSTEADWSSHTVDAGLGRAVAGKRLTLALGGSFVDNQVGRAGDPHFARALRGASGSLAATLILSPRSLVQATWFLGYLAGYQASPYRYAAVGADGTFYPESVPQTRLRTALALRFNRHLFADSALQLHARAYEDDWGVRSLTGGAEYLIGLGEVTFALRARGYAQRHATFYQDGYAAPMRYMTADRELSTFVDVFAGARLAWVRPLPGASSELRAELKADAFRFWFLDFSRLPRRDGVVGELALGVTF
jgi:hypothetical protein